MTHIGKSITAYFRPCDIVCSSVAGGKAVVNTAFPIISSHWIL